jgi:hypothetical protein
MIRAYLLLLRNLNSSCQLDDHIEALYNFRIHHRIATVFCTSTEDIQDMRKYVPLNQGNSEPMAIWLHAGTEDALSICNKVGRQ